LVLMTIDLISEKTRGHWLWFAGIVVLAGAAAAGLWHRAPADTGSPRNAPSPLQVSVAPGRSTAAGGPATGQLRATVAADQAAINSAQVQLGYATITAPIDGRVGLRQLDPGNIIHVNDTNPLTILTLIRPSAVTLTLPQKNVFEVREAILRGPVAASSCS
jgi:hypothetical protein